LANGEFDHDRCEATVSTVGANHDIIKRSSKYEQRNSRRRKNQMTIAEAIREYVNETEGLELYEQEPEKGLGILVKGDNSYMETIMDLTRYFDDHDVDDVNMELEGMYVECQGDDVIVFFPNIEA